MVSLLVRTKDEQRGFAGEIVLARQELPKGHTWGSKENGSDGAPFCVVNIDDDEELNLLCAANPITCVSYPYSEWEPVERVTPDMDNPEEEFVEQTHVRVDSGGRRVSSASIKQVAEITRADLEEASPLQAPTNIVGRKPRTTYFKRPVVKEIT